MPEYLVSINEINYYLSQKIKAEDETEAEEKYMALLYDGFIPVNDSEYSEISVKKL